LSQKLLVRNEAQPGFNIRRLDYDLHLLHISGKIDQNQIDISTTYLS